MGLAGVRRGKSCITTVPDRKAQCRLDKVNRAFEVQRPNALWVVNFTYVHSWAGFVYIAFVIDAFARRIVGWKVSSSATAGFVLDALEQAIHARRPTASDGLVHHSDRRSQYLAMSYTQRLAEAKLVPCVGSVGTPMTMPSPRRSTGCSRLRSSGVSDLGQASRLSKWRRCAGSIGSTTIAYSVPSARSPPLKPRPTTMPHRRNSLWRHDPNQTACGKPGTLHLNVRMFARRLLVKRNIAKMHPVRQNASMAACRRRIISVRPNCRTGVATPVWVAPDRDAVLLAGSEDAVPAA